MKKILTFLLLMTLTLTLSACKEEVPTPDPDPIVDCEISPEHEDCIVEEVDCVLNPEHEDCDVDPILDYYYCEVGDVDCYNIVENIIDTMSLQKKAGQMVQAERGNITPDQVKNFGIGSILSGGGSHPNSFDDSALEWYNMYNQYQSNALLSNDGVPIIYGIDAVHGNNNLYGATIFPHNIGLGAANDADLMYRIGKATAEEMLVTGINWNFAPALSVVQDIRWGRTYEGFSESPLIHQNLTISAILGMEENGVSATAKHFFGDGGTSNGVDQGNTIGNEETLRAIHLAPYYQAIEADVDTIMISYSSINGVKMHEYDYWIQDVLKDEMGFNGFIISDWNAIHQLGGNLRYQVAESINAGVDMLMQPYDWQDAISEIVSAVNANEISMDRIDDAVRRILTVKYYRGLFDNPTYRLDDSYLGNAEHQAIAREAVRKSLVLLQNDNNSLPLVKTEKVFVTGPGANNVGLQSGGWTRFWQGTQTADLGVGSGISDALLAELTANGGELVNTPGEADTIIIVLAENPYAEGIGDNYVMTLTGGNAHNGNAAALQIAAQYNSTKNVVGILLSGRPLLFEDNLQHFDSFIAAWLPGTEGGNGISDVLFGDYDFIGKLSFTWPIDYAQIGYTVNDDEYDPESVLFPYGYGLSYQD